MNLSKITNLVHPDFGGSYSRVWLQNVLIRKTMYDIKISKFHLFVQKILPRKSTLDQTLS